MAAHAPHDGGRPLVGVLLVALATMSFAMSDVLTKHLTALYPASIVVGVRYVVNLGLLTAFFWPRVGADLWRTRRLGMVLLRGFCLAAASLLMGLALQRMPVGETVAIVYLAPFMVMLLAVPLLGEKVTPLGWAGAAFGFLGVLLIARPGGGLDPVGVILAVINAGFATGYHLLTRLLSRTETTVSMIFHSAWVGVLILAVVSIPDLPRAMPEGTDIAMMIALGGFMTLGHLFFTAGYREAPASMLAPVNYLHLVWAGGLGWLFFSHVPDGLALAGMTLVAGAGVMVALGARTWKPRHPRGLS